MEIGDAREGGGEWENGDKEEEGIGGLMEVRGEGELEESSKAALGLILFSFCLLLQNQTLTTSRSMLRLSETYAISSLVGLGLELKALSSATLMVVSMDVLFFRLLLMASC